MKFSSFAITLLLIDNCKANLISKALNSLLSEQTCTLFWFNMDKKNIKNVEINLDRKLLSKIPKASIVYSSLRSFKSQTRTLTQEASCVLGITHFDKINQLQEALLPVPNRQLLIVDVHGNDSTRNIDVHRYHHPIVYLNENSKGFVKQSVICKNNRRITTNIYNGNWNLPKTMSILDTERLCNKGNHPLHGTTFKTVVYGVKPFLIVKNGKQAVDGAIIDLLRLIAGKHNFNYEIKSSKTWFIFHKNGSIEGSLGELVSQRVDIDLEQSYGVGNNFGQQTSPTYNLDYSFIELSPEPLPLYLNIVYTLDIYTWLSFCLAMLLVSIVLNIVSCGCHKQIYPRTQIIEMTVGIVFQEYYLGNKTTIPKAAAVLRFAWVVTAMFMTMALTSNLKSSLVKSRHEKRTMTMNEMIDKDLTIHVTEQTESYIASSFANSSLNSRLLCQVRKKNSVSPYNSDEPLRQMYQPVLDHGGATVSAEQTLQVIRNDHIKRREDFPIVKIPDRYVSIPCGMVFQRYDPRIQYFNSNIETARDTGLTDHYINKGMPMKNMREPTPVSKDALVLDHFLLPLMISSAGIIITIMIFIFEHDSPRSICCAVLNMTFMME